MIFFICFKLILITHRHSESLWCTPYWIIVLSIRIICFPCQCLSSILVRFVAWKHQCKNVHTHTHTKFLKWWEGTMVSLALFCFEDPGPTPVPRAISLFLPIIPHILLFISPIIIYLRKKSCCWDKGKKGTRKNKGLCCHSSCLVQQSSVCDSVWWKGPDSALLAFAQDRFKLTGSLGSESFIKQRPHGCACTWVCVKRIRRKETWVALGTCVTGRARMRGPAGSVLHELSCILSSILAKPLLDSS